METFTEPRPEALEWLGPARRRRRLRGWRDVGPRVERSGSGTGTHLPGQLWLSLRQPRTQLVNALHTSEISHTGFAGLACLWLAVCGALQQTCDSSKDLL